MSDSSSRQVDFFRHALGDAELASFEETLRSLFLTMGPRCAEFERAFSEWAEVEHVVGVSSCSMGLIMALEALGIQEGDEVITTPMTWVSTANAALFHKATPVFVDIDPETGLIDAESVEAAITPKTRAIIVVHLFGQMVDMRAFRQLADRHQVALIEDAAHAVEASRDGIRPGQLGDCSTYSFYATKAMTCGDGGAIATRDPELAKRLRALRNHGVTKTAAQRYNQGKFVHWDMLAWGYKAVLSDVNASLLIPQIPLLEEHSEQRAERVARYEELLASNPSITRTKHKGASAHHLFTVQVDTPLRDRVLDRLLEHKIGCTVNYPSLPSLHYYRELGYNPEDYPNAKRFGEAVLSLPLWPALPMEDVDYVCEILEQIMTEFDS